MNKHFKFAHYDERLLHKHIHLVVSEAETIKNTPEYFYCQPKGSDASLSPIGGGPLNLGILLQIWDERMDPSICPYCGGHPFLIGLHGSVLSGTHWLRGFCTQCCEPMFWKRPGSFVEFAVRIRELIHKHRNKPIIEPGERQRFSWGKGVEGENNPDRVIRPAVEAKTLSQVLWELGNEYLKKELENEFDFIPPLKSKESEDSRNYGDIRIKGKYISGNSYLK